MEKQKECVEAVQKKNFAGAYVAPSADIIGDVSLAKDSSIWYQSCLLYTSVVTLVCCGISEKDMQVKRWKLIWRILPWILMLVLSQWHGYWSGAKYWINMIISRWNLIHDGGVALFRTTAGEQEEVAFLLLAVTALIQLGWWIVRKRRLCIATVYGLCWMFLALFTGIFHPLAVCTLFCAFLGLRLSDRNMNTVRRKLFWFVCLGVFAAAGALTLPAQDLLSVTEFREQVKTEIHTWRYGEDSLPEGNLRQAEMLHDSSNEMLRVQSEQIKMMYFRGFIGGRYSDGQWSQMPDSAYGGENAGILNWLSEHGFDPMTQVADYYGLCTEDNLCLLYTSVFVLSKEIEEADSVIDKDTILNYDQYPDPGKMVNLFYYQYAYLGEDRITELFPGWEENGELVPWYYRCV